jgi:hypothetical protein
LWLVSAEDAVDQRDWSRVEQELGELVPRVDVSLNRPSAPVQSRAANRNPSSRERSTESVLEQITRALESDGIVSK